MYRANRIVKALSTTVLLALVFPFVSSVAAQEDYSSVRIAPPPGGGIYLGQYEWQVGDIAAFEAAAGRKTAWFAPYGVEATRRGPIFDAEEAEHSWAEGKIMLVHAIEATPDPTDQIVPGFTVDKLLKGKYDRQLRKLARQFRKFGKPIFFHTAREPLGIGINWMGGFGKKGNKSTIWALKRGKGFAEFDPSGYRRAELYADLGDPEVSDGVERLVAAQRYYYDFFVRRQGLTFLTFDTMGWNTNTPQMIACEARGYVEDYPGVDLEHALRLLESSWDFANFYPGDDYVDWVSINFYMLDYYAEFWEGLDEDFLVPLSDGFDYLAYVMKQVRRVAPGKPVFFLEFGLPDGMNQDSARAARKIRRTLPLLLKKYPEIHGISWWSFHPSWFDIFPFECLVRPGTRQADALREVLADHPGKFHSCVTFSDGRQIPNCSP